jgi:biofilm protein TabA
MIIAKINNDELDCLNNFYFKKAFEFLRNKDLINLEPGKYEIEGEKVFALVSSCFGKGKKEACLERHKKYIDLQYCIKGVDCIGFKLVDDCRTVLTAYDKKKDIEFFKDNIESYFLLKPGYFAIFYPSDAHAPLSCNKDQEVLKVVVKIAV